MFENMRYVPSKVMGRTGLTSKTRHWRIIVMSGVRMDLGLFLGFKPFPTVSSDFTCTNKEDMTYKKEQRRAVVNQTLQTRQI